MIPARFFIDCLQEIFCGRYSIRIAQYIMNRSSGMSTFKKKREMLKNADSGAYAMTGGVYKKWTKSSGSRQD
jgi:hypothetical protein